MRVIEAAAGMTLLVATAACSAPVTPDAEIRTIKAGHDYAMVVPAAAKAMNVEADARRLCDGALVGCSVWAWWKPEPVPQSLAEVSAAEGRAVFILSTKDPLKRSFARFDCHRIRGLPSGKCLRPTDSLFNVAVAR